MRLIHFSGALALALSACGQAGSGDGSAQGRAAGPIYSGRGKTIVLSGDKISISHGPIAGIGWPAMTMTFHAGGLAAGFKPGDAVTFSFRKAGPDYPLTSLARVQ